MHTELPFCHLMMQFCFPSSHLQITEVCFASESWCQVRLMCSRTRVQGLLFSPPERMVTYEAAQCGLEAWEAPGSHSVGSGADASHPDDGALRSSRQKKETQRKQRDGQRCTRAQQVRGGETELHHKMAEWELSMHFVNSFFYSLLCLIGS